MSHSRKGATYKKRWHNKIERTRQWVTSVTSELKAELSQDQEKPRVTSIQSGQFISPGYYTNLKLQHERKQLQQQLEPGETLSTAETLLNFDSSNSRSPLTPNPETEPIASISSDFSQLLHSDNFFDDAAVNISSSSSPEPNFFYSDNISRYFHSLTEYSSAEGIRITETSEEAVYIEEIAPFLQKKD